MSSTRYTTIAWLPSPRLAETATCLPSGEMRGEVTWSVSAKASTGTGSAAWEQMQASPNAAATTAMLHCFMRFTKPAPPAGRPRIRSADVRWRGGAPPMDVGGAVDRNSIFPAALYGYGAVEGKSV